MTKTQGTAQLIEWIKANLVAIVVPSATAFCGSLILMNNMANQIRTLERDIGRLERNTARTMVERRGFMNDSALILNELCGESERCRSRYDPVRVPE